MDTKTKFLEATAKYLDISHHLPPAASVARREKINPGEWTIETQEEALSHCIICLVLASAGPQRAKYLNILAKDERIASLPVTPMLEMMYVGDPIPCLYYFVSQFGGRYLDRIVSTDDVKDFQRHLRPHQKALTKKGETLKPAYAIHFNHGITMD